MIKTTLKFLIIKISSYSKFSKRKNKESILIPKIGLAPAKSGTARLASDEVATLRGAEVGIITVAGVEERAHAAPKKPATTMAAAITSQASKDKKNPPI